MAKKAILILEPDQDLGKLLADVLETEGYEVKATESFAEAKEVLSVSNFDLIITEAFGQNDVLRFEPHFLDELRSHAGAARILLCSTHLTTERLRAGRCGLAEVVAKPFAVHDLINSVNNLLNGAK